MMEKEIEEIEILYFDKEYFYRYFDDWREGAKSIPLRDHNWDYFFKPKKEKHLVLEIIEYENGLKFLVLEDDIIWYEAIPGFKDGEFSWISKNSRLISMSDLREKGKIYNILFDMNPGNSFPELYKILDRSDK